MLKTTYPEAPKGKRSARRNIYGNTNLYVGTKKFWELGCGASAERDSELFVKGYSLESIHDGTAYEAEGII